MHTCYPQLVRDIVLNESNERKQSAQKKQAKQTNNMKYKIKAKEQIKTKQVKKTVKKEKQIKTLPWGLAQARSLHVDQRPSEMTLDVVC